MAAVLLSGYMDPAQKLCTDPAAQSRGYGPRQWLMCSLYLKSLVQVFNLIVTVSCSDLVCSFLIFAPSSHFSWMVSFILTLLVATASRFVSLHSVDPSHDPREALGHSLVGHSVTSQKKCMILGGRSQGGCPFTHKPSPFVHMEMRLLALTRPELCRRLRCHSLP